MTKGLTPLGFDRKTYTEILADKEQLARNLFGENINLGDNSPMGKFIRIITFEESKIWETAENVYNSAFVNTAEGVNLNHVCKYIGISRQPATRATGEVTFEGDDDTVIPVGFLVETAGEIQFRVTEDGVVAGGEVTVPVQAVLTGVAGNVSAGTVTLITNPTVVLTSVTNAAPMTGGQNMETDTALRARYQMSVARPGSSTSESIEATLLDIEGVMDAICRVNETMAPVGDIPPKSIAPIVYGGISQDIAEAIFATKAAGIQSAAAPPPPDPLGEEVTITDSRGVDHVIGFARPEEVDIYVDAELAVDDNYPVDGDALVAAAIDNYINDLGLGDDVIYTRIIAVMQTVPGIVDITTLYVGVAPDPDGTINIAIDDLQVAIPFDVQVVSV